MRHIAAAVAIAMGAMVLLLSVAVCLTAAW